MLGSYFLLVPASSFPLAFYFQAFLSGELDKVKGVLMAYTLKASPFSVISQSKEYTGHYILYSNLKEIPYDY